MNVLIAFGFVSLVFAIGKRFFVVEDWRRK